MGNLGGGEVLVILLVALIVLGPTKLPTAIRQVGRFMGEIRRIGAGFQQELREAAEPLSEPLRETKATLKAADRELREVTRSLKETAATPRAADVDDGTVEGDTRTGGATGTDAGTSGAC